MRGHRWFAALYDIFEKLSAKQLAPVRRNVAGGATGRVLEIGCGTGANLRFYDWTKIESLDAADPDPFMLGRARRKAAALPKGARLTFHSATAEALPFPRQTFDTVVATLVLCTVESPALALAEIERVLRPGGSLRMLEHVRGHGLTARVQDFLQPVYGRLAAGCHWNRATEDFTQAAGFRLEVDQRLSFGPGFPAFAGVAHRA